MKTIYVYAFIYLYILNYPDKLFLLDYPQRFKKKICVPPSELWEGISLKKSNTY